MGAWGVLAFDNDEACDWAYDLDGTTDLSLVEAAFATVERARWFLVQGDASCGLAACEVIARMLGRPGYTNAYTEKVDRWVAEHPQPVPRQVVERAAAVIDGVLGRRSELRGLW